MRFEYAIASEGSTRSAYKGRNHDAFFVGEQNGVLAFGVADGCKPIVPAQIASTELIESFKRHDPWTRGPVECLRRSIKDRTFIDKLCLAERVHDMLAETTGVLCRLDSNGVLCAAYIGDSEIRVFNGELIFSEPHQSITDNKVCLDRVIDKSTSVYDVEAFCHQKLDCKRSGSDRHIQLEPDTIVIALTDGAYKKIPWYWWNWISTARKYISLQAIADQLVKEGRQYDDATAVVVRVRSD